MRLGDSLMLVQPNCFIMFVLSPRIPFSSTIVLLSDQKMYAVAILILFFADCDVDRICLG